MVGSGPGRPAPASRHPTDEAGKGAPGPGGAAAGPAGDALYRKHVDELLRHARRLLGSDGDAEDLVHDCFVRAAPALEAGRVENARAYLFMIVSNLARDHWRRRREASGVLPEPVDEHGPEVDLAAREALARVTRALQRLPERQRRALELKRIEGWSVARIANTLGVAPKTVENHLTLALRRLRELIGDLP